MRSNNTFVPDLFVGLLKAGKNVSRMQKQFSPYEWQEWCYIAGAKKKEVFLRTWLPRTESV